MESFIKNLKEIREVYYGDVVFISGENEGRGGRYYDDIEEDGKALALVRFNDDLYDINVVAVPKTYLKNSSEHSWEAKLEDECWKNFKSPKGLTFGPVSIDNEEFSAYKIGYYDDDMYEFDEGQIMAKVIVGKYEEQQYILVPHSSIKNVTTVEHQRQLKELEGIRPGIVEALGLRN